MSATLLRRHLNDALMQWTRRTKARRAEGEEQASLLARWRTVHDICSLSACLSAFSICYDDELTDLGAHVAEIYDGCVC